jgi:RecB family exonuclease
VSEPVRLLSNSEAQTFKDCRRAWWLRWHRGLAKPEEAVTGPLALGTQVHRALAAMYSPTDQRDPVEVLRQGYLTDLEAYPSDEEGLQKDMALALAMVEGYVEWVAETGADDWFDVVGEEVPLRVPLIPGEVDLVGRIDLLIRRRSDGALAALDHKTTASLDAPLKVVHMNEQGRTYALLLKLTYPDAPVAGAVWSWLKKSKRTARAVPPFYSREDLWYTDRELRTFYTRLAGTYRDLRGVADQLDAGADHLYVAYPRPSDTCSWKCEFFPVCPLFDDGSHVEGALQMAYAVRSPYDRYLDVRDAA